MPDGEVVRMSRRSCDIQNAARVTKARRAAYTTSPRLSKTVWWGVTLFVCLFIHATLSAINTQVQKHNYNIERLNMMLRMRNESLQCAISRLLSPGHAEFVAEQSGMRKANTKDCEFVVLESIHSSSRYARKYRLHPVKTAAMPSRDFAVSGEE